MAANTNVIRTRYALLGVAPLILLAGWVAAEFLALVPVRRRSLRVAVQGLVLLALLAWPFGVTSAQLGDYAAPTLLAMDRSEYLAACSAGSAAQQAVQWLGHESEREPITVITGAGFGLQNDLPWLELRNQPAIQLFCTDQRPLFMTPTPQRLALGVEQWYPLRMVSVVLSPGQPVYLIAPMSRDSRGRLACLPAISSYASSARMVTLFENPPEAPNGAANSGLAILRIDPPMEYGQQ